jgi:protein TonB
MEEKKTTKANLENERSLFFLLGLVVVLSTLFVALEWSDEESSLSDWEGLSPLFIEEQLIGLDETPVENVAEETTPPEENTETDTPVQVVYDDFNVVEQMPDSVELEEDTVEKQASLIQEDPVSLLTEKEIDDIVHAQAEVMPEFEGGYAELVRFIYRNTQYPPVALKQRIQGKVWCSFHINTDGSVSDVKVEQGVSLYLDDEAIRVLKSMPPWHPGTIAGKPVKVKIYLPVVFRL